MGAWRALMGPTNALKAREAAEAAAPLDEDSWPLRALYGTDGTRNATHGSDSEYSAWRETCFFFPELDPDAWSRSVALVLPHAVAAGRAAGGDGGPGTGEAAMAVEPDPGDPDCAGAVELLWAAVAAVAVAAVAAAPTEPRSPATVVYLETKRGRGDLRDKKNIKKPTLHP